MSTVERKIHISDAKPVTILFDPALHLAMKELAKRRRMHVGALYEQAIESFLDTINNPEAFMGKKSQPKAKN